MLCDNRKNMENKKKILVVEDEIALLEALTEKLTKENFEVLQAKNGQEGLQQGLNLHPDLILLDILMPVMDGMTMLTKLRADDWGKSVPIIILTNLSDEQKVSESLSAGVFDYLVKSGWTLEDLTKKIKDRLGIAY